MGLRGKFVRFLQSVRSGLFGSEPYLAVHWRRGDQLLTKCKVKHDTSANCGSAEGLRDLIQAKLHGRPWRVYVATNEKNMSILTQLRGFGYNLQSDAGLHFNSLESFFADLYLLGCANDALMPGFAFTAKASGVHKMVHQFRKYHASRSDTCGESRRTVDTVNCGRFLAASCEFCQKGDCSGDCAWDGTSCVVASVSCGLHRALNCSLCPQDHGEEWCRGDCAWDGAACHDT